MQYLILMIASMVFTFFVIKAIISVKKQKVKVKKGGIVFLYLLILFGIFIFALSFFRYFNLSI